MEFNYLTKAVENYFKGTFKGDKEIKVTPNELNKSFVARITIGADTYKYYMQVIGDEQLLDMYELKTTTYVYRGTLIESEVIGGHTNVLEFVGDGHGGYEVRQAEYEYVFRSKSIEFKN